MKLFTVTLILAIQLFFLGDLNGQERINRSKIQFTKSSGKLTSATGWAINPTSGEWIDYPNMISTSKAFKNKLNLPPGSLNMSRASQNFVYLQFKSIDFNGKEYYILIHEKWFGHYTYPNIQEDWNFYTKTFAYIFDEDEFKKLFRLEGLIELKTNNLVNISHQYNHFKESDLLDLIHSKLLSGPDQFSSTFTFPILKSTEGNIRFFTPSYFPSYFMYDFDTNYFETDLVNFSTLVQLKNQ